MSVRWRVTRLDTGASWEGAEGFGAASDVARVVRMAARPLGLQVPGRSQGSERSGQDDWTATWSGVALHVHRIRPRSGPSGDVVSHRDRQASGETRVDVYVATDAGEALARGVTTHGSRRAAVEHALRQAYPTSYDNSDWSRR